MTDGRWLFSSILIVDLFISVEKKFEIQQVHETCRTIARTEKF